MEFLRLGVRRPLSRRPSPHRRLRSLPCSFHRQLPCRPCSCRHPMQHRPLLSRQLMEPRHLSRCHQLMSPLHSPRHRLGCFRQSTYLPCSAFHHPKARHLPMCPQRRWNHPSKSSRRRRSLHLPMSCHRCLSFRRLPRHCPQSRCRPLPRHRPPPRIRRCSLSQLPPTHLQHPLFQRSQACRRHSCPPRHWFARHSSFRRASKHRRCCSRHPSVCRHCRWTCQQYHRCSTPNPPSDGTRRNPC
jgi:hypothetical protein